MVPRTVLTRSGSISLNTARPVNTVQPRTIVNNAGPMKNVIKNAYSTARRPFNNIIAANNSNFTKKVNTFMGTRVNTARPKAVLSVVKGNKGNAIKASECWVWRPKHKVLDHGNPQQDLKDKGVIDNGCSRHMIGNRSYLTNYEEINRGFVAFGGNQYNGNAGTKACDNAGEYKKKVAEEPGKEGGDSSNDQEKDDNVNNTNNINTASDENNTDNVNVVSSSINAASIEVNVVGSKTSIKLPNDLNMPELEDIVYSDDDEDVCAEANINNLDAFMHVSPILTTTIHKDHPVEQIIRDLNSAPQTRRITKNLKEHGLFSSVQNKKDERGIVINNKARLVAQRYTQEEGIDYDKVFAPISRIETIRVLFYGNMKEEVYVCQPPRFEDPYFPDKVYKVEKVLYGLHQAPIAWYETLSSYLLDNRFQRRKIDKTMFIRRDKGDILIVQVYVDDLIYSSIKKSLCTEFKKMMHKKFQMSSMGKLTFFLGLQVKQKEDGIFLIQNKYVTEILNKFGFSDVKTASTPMETHKPLLKDADGEDVDEYMYRSMIRSLMYLTSSRPDIIKQIRLPEPLVLLGSNISYRVV
ncbi:putative ribonuclease H-like domain-containing protein [Tanacetum coccineum]